MAALVVGVVLDGRIEEGVDEGRLSEARLARHLSTVNAHPGDETQYPYHDSEGGATLCDNLVTADRLMMDFAGARGAYRWFGS